MLPWQLLPVHTKPESRVLEFQPGLLTEWGWSDDKKQVWMKVREGVKWHDGSPFTAEDVVWSLERAGKMDGGNPIAFIWSKIGNFKVDGNKITADVLQFEPTLFKWMAFLTGYVMPKAYFEKVGAEGFEAAPIGTGPYMVEKFEQNAFVRLKADHGCPARTVWSTDYSEPFVIAPWYEGGSAPVTIPLPNLADRKLLKAMKPNVSFVVPKDLQNLLGGDPQKLLKGEKPGDSTTIGWICSFSIPVITFCAFIVLNLFLSLFDLIFGWLRFIKICLPYPKKGNS